FRYYARTYSSHFYCESLYSTDI
ncbi:hypothetical protein A5834_001813, partial [Enterococcus faecium]